MSTVLAIVLFTLASMPAFAQTKPTPAPRTTTQAKATQSNPNRIGVRGFATLGSIIFAAEDSFDAILDAHSGLVFGGGVQVLLRWGIYAEVAASRFQRDGERAFVGSDGEVFPLGIPTEITMTPLEITGGWRYRHCPRAMRMRGCEPKLIPYAGGGFSSYKYSETSEFSNSSEDVDDRFSGFHLVGGADYRVARLIAFGGEILWASIPDALGSGGVSDVFGEDNLGGLTLRVKISIGR
jgi:opacity protein-like surface antigen